MQCAIAIQLCVRARLVILILSFSFLTVCPVTPMIRSLFVGPFRFEELRFAKIPTVCRHVGQSFAD